MWWAMFLSFPPSSSFTPWTRTTMCSHTFSLDNVPQENKVCRESRGEVAAEWTSHESLLSVLNWGTIWKSECEGHL